MYMGRTEADRKITSEPWYSMYKSTRNKEPTLRNGVVRSKTFDRPDIVSDVRLRRYEAREVYPHVSQETNIQQNDLELRSIQGILPQLHIRKFKSR